MWELKLIAELSIWLIPDLAKLVASYLRPKKLELTWFPKHIGIIYDVTISAIAGDVKIFASTENNYIHVFNIMGEELYHFGGPGNLPGQLNYPSRLAVGMDMLWVIDKCNARIQAFDPIGNLKHCWNYSLFAGDDAKSYVCHLYIDDYTQHIHLLFSSGTGFKLYTLAANGQLLRAFPLPNCVTIGPSSAGHGNLYQPYGSCTLRYDYNYQFIDSLPIFPRTPEGIAFNLDKQMIFRVPDGINCYTLDGQLLTHCEVPDLDFRATRITAHNNFVCLSYRYFHQCYVVFAVIIIAI